MTNPVSLARARTFDGPQDVPSVGPQDARIAPIAFKSIRDFQEYFTNHNRLELLPNQLMRIQDVRGVIVNTSQAEVDEPRFESRIFYVLNQISKLVAPLGKTFALINFVDQNIEFREREDIEVVFPRGALVEARNAEPLYVRPSVLFKTMLASLRLTFQCRHLTFIGLKQEIIRSDDIVGSLGDILQSSIPLGFKLDTNAGEYSIDHGTLTFGSTAPQNQINLQAPEGITFTILESHTFKFTEKSFIDRMLLSPKMTIPAGKKLQIRGRGVLEAALEWLEEFKGKINLSDFVMGQLFLPLGKCIDARGERISCNFVNDLLEIYSSSEVSLELVNNDMLWINLGSLEKKLNVFKRTAIHVQPEQRLVFYGVSPNEMPKVRGWIAATNIEETIKGFNEFSRNHLPVGYIWGLSCSEDLTVAQFGDQDSDWPGVFSSNKMTLSLLRPQSGSLFALSIVQHSHKDLGTGLADREIHAILNLLFKSVSYFCFSNYFEFKTKDIPNYFKPETAAKIRETLNDPVYEEHLKKIPLKQELLQRMCEFHLASPQGFDQMALVEDASIQFVLNGIKSIASIESQGGNYVQLSLLLVSNYLGRDTRIEEMRAL